MLVLTECDLEVEQKPDGAINLVMNMNIAMSLDRSELR